MHQFVDFIVNMVGSMGYTWIFIMMVIESSFIPFPSEVAMIPAGYLASQWQMNFLIALLVGTLWALWWAIINYILGYYLWEKIIKKIIKKYGKYMFLSVEHYEKSEIFFQKHGSVTTFLWRFISWVRQIISLPAWVFKMNIPKFLFYTFFGAGLWNLALMVVGYIAWENKELIWRYSHELLIGSIFIIVWIWGIYFLTHTYLCKKKKTFSK
jgi:membrane protein DedA with SNARE-associated domain